MKLDAKFEGEIRKVKDGSIVPEDQYVVFLAKDNAFAAILPLYLEKCIEIGCDGQHVHSVARMMGRLQSWRTDHPELLKNPDAKGERLLDQGALNHEPKEAGSGHCKYCDGYGDQQWGNPCPSRTGAPR